MSIIVMVDGCASLSNAIIKKYGLAVLPYNVMFQNGECYRDKVDIKNQEKLISLIEMHNEIPRIDQVSEEEIYKYFAKYINNGDDILYISVSSKLSKAYDEVVNVAKRFDDSTIEVIDSLNIGCGETLLALFAIDYINKGHGLKQTTRYLNDIKHSIRTCYTVGNVTYLYFQRRCNQLYDKYLEFYKRFPVAIMNDGEITLTYSAKENDLAMQMIKNTICDYSRVIDHSHLLIGYSLNKDVAFKFKKQTNKLIKDLDAELVESSSATFINTGKNSIGVSFLVNKD